VIEQEGFELTSFTVVTPAGCALDKEADEVVDRILKELGPLGVKEVGHYAEYFVEVERIFDMSLPTQYYSVVEGLRKILK